jgi:hypothetical protein
MVWVATSPMCATNFSFRFVRLSAKVARAQVRHDMLPLDVEGAVHGYGGLDGRSDRGVAVQFVSLPREEGRVAFDLD